MRRVSPPFYAYFAFTTMVSTSLRLHVPARLCLTRALAGPTVPIAHLPADDVVSCVRRSERRRPASVPGRPYRDLNWHIVIQSSFAFGFLIRTDPISAGSDGPCSGVDVGNREQNRRRRSRAQRRREQIVFQC